MFSQAFQHRVQLMSLKSDLCSGEFFWSVDDATINSCKALSAANETSDMLLKAIFSTYSRSRTQALE